MKRFLLFFVLFACLMFSSCLQKDGTSEETSPAETVTISETEPEESETMHYAEETVALETEFLETEIPETEIPETEIPETAEPETELTVSAPPFGTPGVFFADSFAVLREIAFSEAFLSYADRPVICITEAFELEEAVIIPKAADVIYTPEECVGGEPITVMCGDTTESVRVATASPVLMESGLLCVDAPFASLEVVGDPLPAASAVFLYCNVAEYNGVVAREYGGEGTARLTDVILMNPVTNGSYDGVSLSVFGNLAVVKLPLVLSEQELRSATVEFSTTDGGKLRLENIDLTVPCSVTAVDSEGRERIYLVISERLSYDLPVMEIHTEEGAEIVEKNTYIRGTLTIDGESYPMKIRGRGNASWNIFPKKAYRIKLNDGAPLFGLPENRDWVLASNYADKTMIRNCVAHTIAASLSGLEYTPTHFPVNLYWNGQYLGVYTFADKIEEGNGRLDLGNTVVTEENGDVGFLLEIGWDFDEENVYNRDYFDTEKAFRVFVKEPEIKEANSPEFLSLYYYIINMENAIANDDGWENYIDVESWVDWMIVNELTFNTESSFYRSCYLWRPSGGKLKMGPVWDFDMAFGNHFGDLPGYDGWCTTESSYQYISENWMNDLMQYPAFTDRLVERWNEVKNSLLITALDAVDSYSAMLDGSEEQNFIVWDILGTWVGVGSVDPYVYNTYDKQVQYLRDFIMSRWNYIDTRLNSEEYNPSSEG